VIVILHLVGLVGLSSREWSALFSQLSPITLLITTGLVLLCQPQWSRRFAAFLALCIVVGYGIELAGVHTGVVFGGDYAYGPNLGPKVAEVPPLMGLLWFLLVFSAGTLVKALAAKTKLLSSRISRAALGALLLVVMDFPMEYLAQPLDYWTWEFSFRGMPILGAAPLLNYATWFVVAGGLLMAFDAWASTGRRNTVALAVLPVQFSFFVLLKLITSFV
jgi:putative membrane protein